MQGDATYTVQHSTDAVQTLNARERLKLTRRGYTPDEVTLVIITFDNLPPHKNRDVSKFASMQTPIDSWETVAPILPIRIKNAAGDTCILASLDLPHHVRLVIERDFVDEAIQNITSEMGKFDLLLVKDTPTLP